MTEPIRTACLLCCSRDVRILASTVQAPYSASSRTPGHNSEREPFSSAWLLLLQVWQERGGTAISAPCLQLQRVRRRSLHDPLQLVAHIVHSHKKSSVEAAKPSDVTIKC